MLKKTTVNFNNQAISVVSLKNDLFIAIKPLSDYLGMDWLNTVTRANNFYAEDIKVLQISKNSKSEACLCLSLSKLSGFIYSTSASDIKPEFTQALIDFQKHCTQILTGNHPPRYSDELTLLIAPLLKNKSLAA